MSSLTTFIRRFGDFNVLVIGDAILDVYENGHTDKLCREAPVPVVRLDSEVLSCGGAANTAVNTAGLGAHVGLLTVVGDDIHGEQLLDELERYGVDTRHVIRSRKRHTLTKRRVCAASNILVRVDEGDTNELDDALRDELAEAFRQQIRGFDVVIMSDYGYGLFSDALIESFRETVADFDLPVIVDARNPSRLKSLAPRAVKPNYEEVLSLLGLEPRQGEDRIGQLLDHADEIRQATGARIVAATLDTNGTVLFEEGEAPFQIGCTPRPDARTIGAGDSFVGALALALASGAPARAAVRIATAAAEVVLDKDGTGICTDDDLYVHFRGQEKRVRDPQLLVEKLEHLRRQNKRIVFTNGCFDILHRGHIDFLKQARALGDVLVVALNSDDSIRHLKGDSRPVNTLDDRLEVLSAIHAVDFLVPFDDESPAALIKAIRPDILAKGGTYSVDSVPEVDLVREQGGEVEIIPFRTEVSTQHLIQRIQRSAPGRSAWHAGRGAL